MSWTTIVTSSTIQWSDGSNFQGSLLLFFLPPDLGAGVYPNIYPRYSLGSRHLPLPLPKRIAIPIINGVLQDNKILPTSQLSPPNVKFYAFWIDSAGALIASGPSLFSITSTGDYTITPPTLTAPTAETDTPTLTPSVSGAITNTIVSVTATREELTGTKNGVNTTFTISRAPDQLLFIFYNGLAIDEGVSADYTRSGTTITLAVAPQSSDILEALII